MIIVNMNGKQELKKRFFLTEQECMRYYQNNSRYLDKKTLEIIQKEFDKFEIIHVGCMKTTALMDIKQLTTR